MRILFIGPYSYGSTTKMRGDIIRNMFQDSSFTVIDTDNSLFKTTRIFRSLGFRYKIGPLIKNINDYIINNIIGKYDLTWIEKGVFITKKTLENIRDVTVTLVHFTPDPAFLYHKSRHFLNSLPLYDYCITTKSFEQSIYKDKGVKNLILTTQGYDPNIHTQSVNFKDKSGICFVGHYEKERAEIIRKLLTAGFEIKLAGIKWEGFVKNNSFNKNLKYYGKQVNGLEYSKLISSSLIGLGFLSNWIPELHTTRTFEIPACGTLLVTESNNETKSFFTDEQVIFYKNENEILNKIEYYMANPELLKIKSEAGYERVRSGGFNYESILKNIFSKTGFIN